MEQKLNMNVNVQGNEAIIRMGKATEPFNYPAPYIRLFLRIPLLIL